MVLPLHKHNIKVYCIKLQQALNYCDKNKRLDGTKLLHQKTNDVPCLNIVLIQENRRSFANLAPLFVFVKQ